MSDTKTYKVESMTCQHCVMSVTEEISAIAGIENVDVDLETGLVKVTSKNSIDDAQIYAAVEQAGYKIKES